MYTKLERDGWDGGEGDEVGWDVDVAWDIYIYIIYIFSIVWPVM